MLEFFNYLPVEKFYIQSCGKLDFWKISRMKLSFLNIIPWFEKKKKLMGFPEFWRKIDQISLFQGDFVRQIWVQKAWNKSKDGLGTLSHILVISSFLRIFCLFDCISNLKFFFRKNVRWGDFSQESSQRKSLSNSFFDDSKRKIFWMKIFLGQISKNSKRIPQKVFSKIRVRIFSYKTFSDFFFTLEWNFQVKNFGPKKISNEILQTAKVEFSFKKFFPWGKVWWKIFHEND